MTTNPIDDFLDATNLIARLNRLAEPEPVLPEKSWARVPCAGRTGEWFHHGHDEVSKKRDVGCEQCASLKAECQGCPMRLECREIPPWSVTSGIWGGMTARELRNWRKMNASRKAKKAQVTEAI